MKRSTNLSIDAELLKEAKDLDINLSSTLEQALTTLVRHKKAEQWKASNSEAIDSYGQHINAHGTFSDKLRSF